MAIYENTNLQEDYVSFETAKLLKERGFDETVRCFYDIQTEILCDNCVKTKNSYTESIAAPTLQMAMKWLREVHNLFIQITIVPHTIVTMEQKYYLFSIHKDRRWLHKDDIPIDYYNTYEEACEAAIKYCLEKLI